MLPVLQKVKKKKKKWIGKLTNSEAGQKALSGRTPNPTETGIQHHTSFFRKVSLELSPVGKDFGKEGVL